MNFYSQRDPCEAFFQILRNCNISITKPLQLASRLSAQRTDDFTDMLQKLTTEPEKTPIKFPTTQDGRGARLNRPALIQDGISLAGEQALAMYHRYYMEGEKIRPEDLDQFGYRLTARHITIGREYRIFELLPVRSAYGASYSFLSPGHRDSGVIIPRSFNEHKAAVSPLTPRARYAGVGSRKTRATGLSE